MRVCVTYTKTFPGHGRSPTSNLLDDTRVPVITPGTPEANGPPRAKGGAAPPDWSEERATPASRRGAVPPGLTSEERARREGGAVKGDGEVGGGRRRAGQQSERDNRASGESTTPLALRPGPTVRGDRPSPRARGGPL